MLRSRRPRFNSILMVLDGLGLKILQKSPGKKENKNRMTHPIVAKFSHLVRIPWQMCTRLNEILSMNDIYQNAATVKLDWHDKCIDNMYCKNAQNVVISSINWNSTVDDLPRRGSTNIYLSCPMPPSRPGPILRGPAPEVSRGSGSNPGNGFPKM